MIIATIAFILFIILFFMTYCFCVAASRAEEEYQIAFNNYLEELRNEN